jgi:hypothetical protein
VNLHFLNKKLAYHPLDGGVRFPYHINKDSDSTGITAVTVFEYATATTTLNSSHFQETSYNILHCSFCRNPEDW